MGITLALAEQFAARMLAVEPNIDSLPGKLKDAGVQLVSQEEALASANVVVLLVDHAPFRATKPVFAAGQHLIDTKGIWG